MTGGMREGRDLAGWLGASAVTAALFAGAAGAALRAPPGAEGAGQVEAVALDLSVGVVPLAAVLPSEPPAVEMAAPAMQAAPQAEPAPDLPDAEREVVAPPMPVPPMPVLPALDVPQADVDPVMAAAPPPPPQQDPPLDMAESPRPVARPDRERAQARQAESAPRAAPVAAQKAEPVPEAAPPAQAAGSDQAARPAQERRVAGGTSAARYGDQVMRQIARLRRQKAPERGTVTVGFEIGADGGLRQVAVVASSGSEALDRVALDHIRRAAPFPPPPEGATVRFAFEFVGR